MTATRKPLYPIEGLELYIYFGVWIVHAAIAVVLSYWKSQEVGLWFNSALKESQYLPPYMVDDSDTEWFLFRKSVGTIIKAYAIHSIFFRIAQKIPSRSQETLLLLVVWTALFVYTHSWTCYFICFAFVFTVSWISVFFRNELLAWAACILFVLNSGPQWIPYSSDPATFYREYQVYVYTAIKVLNFCIYMCRNRDIEVNPRLVVMYMEFLLYPPYSSTLIVLFDSYLKQRDNVKPFDLKSTVNVAIRLALWFAVIEASLHLLRVNAFFNAPFTMMNNFHNYETLRIVSIAYIAGQYFHTKYVVIFGLDRLFAQVDGMTPPEAAICISRVTKYSRMWRYFDRGLYEFLKFQLYLPLMKGAKSSWELAARRFGAMLAVFAFVLCWHGLNGNFTCWVALSAVELVIERIGYAFYTSKRGVALRTSLGEANFARLSAIACISNVIPGIFGAFFFLDKKDNGLRIFLNVLWAGCKRIITLDIRPYNEGFVMLHLILLGYCFSHVCAYLHEKLDRREKKKSE